MPKIFLLKKGGIFMLEHLKNYYKEVSKLKFNKVLKDFDSCCKWVEKNHYKAAAFVGAEEAFIFLFTESGKGFVIDFYENCPTLVTFGCGGYESVCDDNRIGGMTVELPLATGDVIIPKEVIYEIIDTLLI